MGVGVGVGGVKVASTACLKWSHHHYHHHPPQSPSSSSHGHTLASAISSPSSTQRPPRNHHHRNYPAPLLLLRHLPPNKQSHRSSFFVSTTRLRRSRSSSDYPISRPLLRRTCSSSTNDFFSDHQDSPDHIQELPLNFQLDSHERPRHERGNSVWDHRHPVSDLGDSCQRNARLIDEETETATPEEIIQFHSSTIERKANSVDLPMSLRIIQRKMQWREDGFREAGESAYCSVKKAFSSMVFIIRELQNFALQMREVLFYEDVQGILCRVHKEMHASFVWLFQQIFSHTPTLMVWVMILLANFTVHSMSTNPAMAMPPVPTPSYAATTTEVVEEVRDTKVHKFDPSFIRAYSVSSSTGGTSISGGIGIGNNGGGNPRPVASGMDGDGQYRQSDYYKKILPDGGASASQLSSFGSATREAEAESESSSLSVEEEVSLWNSMVEEAAKMQSEMRDNTLFDHETMHRLVSPVKAKIETDHNYAEYLRTELQYHTSLAQDSNNALLLANYAQFLYLVARDYDRAEEYFKRAVAVEPPDADADAEVHSKYASFLWRVRNDLWGAEETFLNAISVDPANSFYAAEYAHFLWNTGGEETCFPLSKDSARES